jgi:MFS transporter, UMF1 family
MSDAPVMTGAASQRDKTYQQRVRAWVLYDWANSAFATTILAALLPVYYSSVAGATLPSESTATAYWSITLSISLFITAILSPILGTISDVMRGKKRFLAIFTGIGVVGTGLLVFVSTGDWLLASILFLVGRIGFGGALVFYDSLLPHVAKEDDQDRVSSLGYAMGYLGGGILLAINVAMFLLMPNTPFQNAGVRLSFLTVAIWWAVFSIPLLRTVPEPPSAEADLKPGETVLGVSFARLRETFTHLRQYRELFKYLVAYLIYNDAIGTIIGLAAIYGAELGFGLTELVLALLLVQFIGIPFSLIFGGLPSSENKRRGFYLAYILFNVVALPLVGIIGSRVLPPDVVGQRPAPYVTEGEFRGEGVYDVTDTGFFVPTGIWENNTIAGRDQVGEGVLAQLTTALVGMPDDVVYGVTDGPNDDYTFAMNGQDFTLTYAIGPNNGILGINVDGQPLMETVTGDGEDMEQPITLDTYSPTARYNETKTFELLEPGQHTVSLVNLGTHNPDSTGNVIAVAAVEVEPPARQNSLLTVLGLLFALQAVGLVFAYFAQNAFVGLANTLDTRRTILLSLVVYSMVACWGFILDSTIEFWFLAWAVAIVQGGSQALSRSLYASMTPASKSGEFFGLFSIMEKFSSIIGPMLFAIAAALFASSRPAILSLIALFLIGGYLLTRVDITAGQRAAKQEDQEVFGAAE